MRYIALAQDFGLHPRHIRTATDFAAAHREDSKAQVGANAAAAERLRQLVAA